MWTDIATIVFVWVTANHLGLIGAFEKATGLTLWVANCPKCASWWSVMLYMLLLSHDIGTSLAVSFLASYMAIWLELLEGWIDTLYNRLYDKIYKCEADADSAAHGEGRSDG